jgi:hypothetical protein
VQNSCKLNKNSCKFNLEEGTREDALLDYNAGLFHGVLRPPDYWSPYLVAYIGATNISDSFLLACICLLHGGSADAG